MLSPSQGGQKLTNDNQTGLSRLEVVDALRGYALFGLLMVHMVERFELHWLNPQPDPWFDAVFAIFSGKSFAIFALLFGFSFATIMSNQKSRGTDFTWRFAWRVALLFVIGTAHALIYRGDILQVLAVMGLLLIPLDRISSNRALLILSALFLAQLPLLLQSWLAAQGFAAAQAMPYFFSDTGLSTMAEGSFVDTLLVNASEGMTGKWSFYWSTGRVMEIAGLFAIGMVLQRWGAFKSLAMGGWFIALLLSAIVWLALWQFGSILIPSWPEQGGAPMQAQSIAFAVGTWSQLAAMTFQVALFVLLWQTKLRQLIAYFAIPGRMTLTWYVMQSVVVVPLLYGYGLGLWDDLSAAQLVLAGVSFFAAQIAISSWWYKRFRYGALEWIWRSGTMTSFNVSMRR